MNEQPLIFGSKKGVSILRGLLWVVGIVMSLSGYQQILQSPMKPDPYPYVQTINRDEHDVMVSEQTTKWQESRSARLIPAVVVKAKSPAVPSRPSGATLIYTGNVAHYSIGKNSMANVSIRRGMPIVRHMCSSPYLRSQYLGRWITVYSHETKQSFQCRITDVSADEHRSAQLNSGLVLEVDFPTAQTYWNVPYVNAEPNHWNTATIYIH